MGGKGKRAGGKGAKGSWTSTAKGVEESEASVQNLPVGTELTAQHDDGYWYKASVVQVDRRSQYVKVHFLGYDQGDVWVGIDQLRSKLLKGSGKGSNWSARAAPDAKAADELPVVGAGCQVDVGEGKYHPAHVIAISAARAAAPVKVAVELWVRQDQLRAVQKNVAPAATAPAKAAGKGAGSGATSAGVPVGTALTAQGSDGKWYKATVVATRAGKTPLKVHFMGWDDYTDEWKSLEEVRSKLLSRPAADEEKLGTGKGDGAGKGGKGGKGRKGKDVEADESYGYSAEGWSAPAKGKGKSKGKGKNRDAGNDSNEESYYPAPSKGKSKGKGKGKGKGQADWSW